ncbi:kinase-like domain-containing protein [Rhizophagus irregularis DAOM 181602=DAOM 197198]|nr:kinase-like domain-containing protein [Rhizophagus irregularis DAOM 181602=DAOM 197198]
MEKASNLYQKAADNGYKLAFYRLATYYYYNGKEMGKNLEKAFYWFQKAAENGDIAAMNNLAKCYENGEGTEKNLEKTFNWYQKAAENGDIAAMNNLAKLHYDGKGTEMNVEKAFYCKGGFGIIYEAIWLDGPINSWNFDKQQWSRQSNHEVILKSLNDSSKFDEFINEWKYHYNCVPPFSNKVYDNCQLILDICNGERPEIIKGTPKCYIDLMKKCWDGKPENRPTIVSLEHIITQWFRSVSKYYELNEENDEHFAYMDDDILQFRSDIEEFVEANKSLLSQEQTNTYIEQSRPQLSNTSRSF